MTTNQTIDGVPRELLERIMHGCMFSLSRQQHEELRALLDAPAVESELSRMTRRCQNAELALKVQTENYESLKAAQGEPVAWTYRREGGECLGQLVQMESDNLKDVREGKVVEGRRILWPRDDYTDWKPLYAEQPAPVAVALPERREIGPSYPYLSDLDIEWNACVEEFTLLNSNRPAHATPPPGTEPSGTHPHNDGLDEMRKPVCCGSCPGGCVIQKESK